MSKIKDILFNKSIFKIGYMCFVSVNMIPLINELFVTRIFIGLFVVWGATIVLYDLLKRGIKYYLKDFVFIGIIFTASCLLSQLLHFEATGFRSIAMLALSFFCFSILMRNDTDSLEKVKKEIYIINNCFIVICAIAVAISIVMFVVQYSTTIVNRSGDQIRLGYLENRLFGVFTSPNVGGSFSYLSIMMMLINCLLFKENKSKIRATVYIISAILSVIYISLSLSRGTMLSIYLSIIVFFIFFESKNKYLASKRIIKRILVNAVLCVISISAVYALSIVTQTVMAHIPEVYQQVALDNNNASEESGVITFDRIEDKMENVDISNKRFSIWKASIKAVNNEYLFGIGSTKPTPKFDEYVVQGVISGEDYTMLKYANGNTHNGYIQVFTSGGIIAVALLLSFFVITLIRLLKHYKHCDKKYFAVFAMICSYFLINNMIESNIILAGTNVFQTTFWMYLGYFIYFCCNHRKCQKEESTAE